LANDPKPAGNWIERFEEWLADIGFLKSRKPIHFGIPNWNFNEAERRVHATAPATSLVPVQDSKLES
jgi:hypothetical protein